MPWPTSVRTLENAANVFTIGRGNTVSETPRCAASPVKRRVNYFRIVRRHRDINTAHTRGLRRGRSQDRFPRFSRVSRFEQTPVTPIRPKISEGGNSGRFGAFRMNDVTSYSATVLQPNALPRASTITRTINAIAPLRRITVGWFARSNPYNISIARRDCHRADRLHGLLVKR